MSVVAKFADPEELLPHGPSVRFLERVLSLEEEAITCEIVPGKNELAFSRDGTISPALAIEYMAQAIAAFVSLKTGRDHDKPGFVIAVRRFQLATDKLSPGRPLLVRAERRWGEVDVGRFDASILDQADCLVSASLTVFRPTEDTP